MPGQALTPCPQTCSCENVFDVTCSAALWTTGAAAFPNNGGNIQQLTIGGTAGSPFTIFGAINTTELLFGFVDLQVLQLQYIDFLSAPAFVGHPICDMIPNINSIYLQFMSGISTLPVDFFGLNCSMLNVVSLDSMPLTSLPPRLFNNMPNMQTVIITNTLLTTLPSPLLAGSAVNVEILTLLQNNLLHISADIAEGNAMPQLDELNLDVNNLTAISPGFLSGSPLLGLLAVSNNPQLADIPDSVFARNLSVMSSFDAHNCRLTRIPAPLLRLPALTSLNVAGNRLTRFGALPDPSGPAPQLNSLNLANNSITELDPAIFRSSAVFLTTIILSHNLLTTFPPGLFQNMTQLNNLNLNNNELEALPEDMLLGSYALSYFQVSGNNLKSIPSLFNAVSSTFEPGPPQNAFSLLTIVDISHNQLTAIPSTFLRATPSSPLPLYFNELLVSNNNLTTLPDSNFSNFLDLGIVDLSFNQFSRIPQFQNIPPLTTVILSNNRITTFQPSGFSQLPNFYVPPSDTTAAYQLNLQNNLITSLEGLSSSLAPQCGGLILSGNPITAVPPDAFSTLGSLSALDLSYTLITSLPPNALNGLSSLQQLNISHAPLTNISPQAFGSAFGQASEAFGPFLMAGELPSGLYLANTNLSATLREEMFMLVPDLLPIILGGAYLGPSDIPSSFASAADVEAAAAQLRAQVEWSTDENASLPLVLDTCCGYEWLSAEDSRFFFEPEMIRCQLQTTSPFPPVAVSSSAPAPHQLEVAQNLSSYLYPNLTFEGLPWPLSATTPENVTVPYMAGLRGMIICPCLPEVIVLPKSATLSCSSVGMSGVLMSSSNTCNSPFNLNTCASGTILRPLSLRRAVTCVTVTESMQLDTLPGSTGLIVESVCAPCLVDGCQICSTDQALCSSCVTGMSLLPENNTCVSYCPSGYFSTDATSGGVVGNVCKPCIDSGCAICYGNSGDTCGTCSDGLLLFQGRCFSTCPPLYGQGLFSPGTCLPCEVDRCALCTNGTATCTSCIAPFLLFENSCVTNCPPGSFAQTVNSVAVCSEIPAGSEGRSSSSGGLSGAHLAIVIVGSVVLFVVVLGLVVVKMRGRFGVIESDLRERLLSSEEEVLALRQVWQIAPEEVELVRRIDTDSPGAFGEVWLGLLHGSTDVAVKKLRAAHLELNSEAQLEFEQEVGFMQTIRHQNLVAFLGAGEFPDGQPFLVLEYMARGSLRKMLAESPEIAWRRKVRFCHDIVLGMRHLHSLGRIHRDCKSDNVLVAADFRAKVADFGQSRILQRGARGQQSGGSTHRMFAAGVGGSSGSGGSGSGSRNGGETNMLTTNVGTPLWMAPEVLGGQPYDNKADVWSMGIVFWEVLCQELPWNELRHIRGPFLGALLSTIEEGRRPLIPEDTPPAYRKLVEDCWQLDPGQRPSCAALAEYDLFAEIAE